MLNVAAPIWNAVAKTEPLKTKWAGRMFRLDQEKMASAWDGYYLALRRQGVDQTVALAFLTVMPLMQENRAISSYRLNNPAVLEALPEVLGSDEAVILATKEYRLTVSQQKELKALLEKPIE